MLERACLALVALALTVLSVIAVAGHSRFAGEVLFALTPTHGVDEGDVPVALTWLVGMIGLAVLWRRVD